MWVSSRKATETTKRQNDRAPSRRICVLVWLVFMGLANMETLWGQTQQQSQDPELQALRRSATAAVASLKLGNQEIAIRYNPQLSDQSAAFMQIAGLKERAVLAFDQAASLRLRTETDLRFGDTIIKTENHAPNYPGVYSLWLKRARDGWLLAFNSQPDIWGTQHQAAHDVADIPLQWKYLDQPASRLIVELKKEVDNSGLLRIAWGPHEWAVRFTLATRPTAAK